MSLPPLPPSHSSSHHRALGWTLCYLGTSHYLFYTWQYIYTDTHTCICATFLTLPSLIFPHCVHKSILYHVYQYLFSRFHIYALIYNTCFFSFWLNSLCIRDSRFIHFTTADSDLFLSWLSNILFYKCTIISTVHLAIEFLSVIDVKRQWNYVFKELILSMWFYTQLYYHSKLRTQWRYFQIRQNQRSCYSVILAESTNKWGALVTISNFEYWI